jgi:hypothetical protein
MGLAEAVLLPEQSQCDTGTAQLGVSLCPIRYRTLITGNSGRWWEKTSLQLGIGQSRGSNKPAGSKAIEIVTDAGTTHLQADSDLASRQADLEFET